MRIIKNECLGSGTITVSQAEIARGWINCNQCGKALVIPSNHKRSEIVLRRHSRLSLSDLSGFSLPKMEALLANGVRYTKLVRQSKKGNVYSGICSEDGRPHKFNAIYVISIRKVNG